MSSERERESCNSRQFTWLMKSCFPSPNDAVAKLPSPPQPHTNTPAPVTTLSSLPDDIVLDCLSRVPLAFLPALSLVCRRWSRLLRSPAFSYLRRRLHLLRHTTVVLAAIDQGLSVTTLLDAAWLPSLLVPCFDAISSTNSTS
ncbi:hypothetical protein VIGAN_05226800 [Vigna angularis var. angularis]|uniref:F-box domain-containing protein n=1 Tax=Vigna angularis var. angularis TaxID=157739 RepID=A0A0S3S7B2_PHAAN|nr:hypothetical protein VIGAN_05226800 [Vigna angularis var. angularis]